MTETPPWGWGQSGPPCLTDKGLRLRYTPFAPTAKQSLFLSTNCKELFFGGSGGGGKSVALLAGALQFADVPGYAALILRRKLTDLTQPGALISMSREWLDGRDDCSYNANERKWTFRGGGVIQFGYLDHVQDIGRYRGPLHPDTEVLTGAGWKRIGDVQVGETAASVDPVTRRAAMQPVTATWEYDFDGELIEAHQRNGVSFAATPDHTMWYRTNKLTHLRRDTVEALQKYERVWVPRNGTWDDGNDPEVQVFRSPNRKGPKVPDVVFTPLDWAEFLGWWVTEGHVDKGTNAAKITITQLIPEGQRRIEALLTRVGAKWHRYDNRHYSFYNSALADYLREHCGANERATGKKLPRDVFGFSPKFRRVLLDTIIDGDGSLYDDGKMLFVTTSPQLWNDVSELAVKCGLSPTSGTVPRHKFYGNAKQLIPTGKVTYRLSISGNPRADAQLLRSQTKRVAYTGKVHCLTVPPWHSLIIRYRGRVSITGNSQYQYIGWDELGEFPLAFPYEFLFSRLRRPGGLSRQEILRLHGAAPDGTTLLDLPLRVRSASNPGGAGMKWVKERFVDVETRRAPFIPATFHDNPAINAEEYIASLAMLPEVERLRMEFGDWTIQEIPGALWKLADIHRHPWIPDHGYDMFDRTYIGVDPSVGEGAGDECGIIAGGILGNGQVVVIEDASLSAHPDVWSQRAVTVYHKIHATGIVVEQNQGVQLLRTQLRDAADKLGLPQPVILLANAKGSKEARASTITGGYKFPEGDPLVKHAVGLAGGDLEAQMVGWVPGMKGQAIKSPDRVDGLVWLLRGLLYPESIDDFSKGVSTSGGLRSKMSTWAT